MFPLVFSLVSLLVFFAFFPGSAPFVKDRATRVLPYIRVSLNSVVICFGYEFSPNMIDIQEGYNKNFHIKCIEYYEKFESL